MTATPDPEPGVSDEPAILDRDAIASEVGWGGSSNAIVVAGEAGLLIVVLGGIVWALRSLVRALVRTFWKPIKD